MQDHHCLCVLWPYPRAWTHTLRAKRESFPVPTTLCSKATFVGAGCVLETQVTQVVLERESAEAGLNLNPGFKSSRDNIILPCCLFFCVSEFASLGGDRCLVAGKTGEGAPVVQWPGLDNIVWQVIGGY